MNRQPSMFPYDGRGAWSPPPPSGDNIRNRMRARTGWGGASAVTPAATVAPARNDPRFLATGAPDPKHWGRSVGAIPAVVSPAAGNTQILMPAAGPSARERALNSAAQQSGLGPVRWDPNSDTFKAATAAGEAAAAARAAQGGRGYLSAPVVGAPAGQVDWATDAGQSVRAIQEAEAAAAGMTFSDKSGLPTGGGAGFAAAAGQAPGLPDTSNPASPAYWERADIKAWAGANKPLADELRKKHGLAPLGASAAPAGAIQMPSSPVVDTQQAFGMSSLAPETVVPTPAPGQEVVGALTANPGAFDPAQAFNREVLEAIKARNIWRPQP